MSDALGKAQVVIRATLDQLDTDLGDAKKKTDSAAKKMAAGASEAFQKLGKVGLGAFAGAAAAGTAALGAIGLAGFKLAKDASAYVAVENAFADMSEGYVSGTNEILASIADVTGGMVDHQGIMADMGLMYAQTGKSLENWEDTYVNMWERSAQIARAKGLDVEDVQHKVSQAVATGNMQMLRNIGIMPDVSGAYEEYAQSVGRGVTELTEAEKAQVRYNTVMAATDATFGEITVGAATFTDHMQKMQVFANNLALDIGKRLEPLLASLAENLFPLLTLAVDRLMPHLDSLLDWVGSILPRLADGIASMIDILADFFWMLDIGIDPLKAIKMALLALFGPDNPVAAGVAEMVDMFFFAVDAGAGLELGIRNMVGTFLHLIGVSDDMADILFAIFNVVQDIVSPIAQWVSENVKLQDALMGLGVAMAVAAALIVGPVLLAVGKIILTFAVVTAIVAALRAAWENNFLGIRDVTATVWGFIQTFIPAAIHTVRQIITTVVTAIQTFWSNHGDKIKETATRMWEAVVAVFEWFKVQFSMIFEAFALAFEGDWRGFGEKLREVWDRAWQLIKEVGERAWQAIRDFFTNTDWGSIGLSILEGIAKGITGGLAIIGNAAKNAAKSAYDAAMGFLRSDSPSKLFEDVGGTIPSGLSVGITSGAQEAVRAAEQMLGRLVNASQRELSYAAPPSAVLAAAGSGGTGSVTVQVHVDKVGDDMDLEMLARRIAQVIQRRG